MAAAAASGADNNKKSSSGGSEGISLALHGINSDNREGSASAYPSPLSHNTTRTRRASLYYYLSPRAHYSAHMRNKAKTHTAIKQKFACVCVSKLRHWMPTASLHAFGMFIYFMHFYCRKQVTVCFDFRYSINHWCKCHPACNTRAHLYTHTLTHFMNCLALPCFYARARALCECMRRTHAHRHSCVVYLYIAWIIGPFIMFNMTMSELAGVQNHSSSSKLKVLILRHALCKKC